MTSPAPATSGPQSFGAGRGTPAHPATGADDAGPDGQGARADQVVRAVLAVPGVVRLHAGAFGEVATYLPGRAVTGVRLRPDASEVHLVVSTDRPIPAVARDVHEAVRHLVPGPVSVFVEDVESLPAPPFAS